MNRRGFFATILGLPLLAAAPAVLVAKKKSPQELFDLLWRAAENANDWRYHVRIANIDISPLYDRIPPDLNWKLGVPQGIYPRRSA